MVNFKRSNNEEDEKKELGDVIKDEKLNEKENLKSSIKECSTSDEQVSTFKSADTNGGNEEKTVIA